MVTRHSWSRRFGRGGRERAGRAGALTAALCVTAAALGISAPGAWAASKPRLYTMSEDAKKITGTSSSADAPKVAPGLFTDRIEPGEEKYYALDLDAKSDIHVTATGVPEPGSRVTYQDGLTVTLQTTDGHTCSENEADGNGNTAFPLTAYAARLMGDPDDEACRVKGPYLVHVVREEGDNSDPSSWPLELSVLKEPGLKGSIPAPRPGAEEETDDANTRPAPPSGTPEYRKGGTGFNDARAVGDGVWKDRLRAGETRYFRVPVDWGQRLYARVDLPNAANGSETGTRLLPNGFRMNVYNPARSALYSENFQTYDRDGAKFDRYSNPVRYENRFLDDDGVSGTRFAGWYYVAVTVSPDMVQPFPKGTPVTLRIGVEGHAAKGPAYNGDAKAAGFGVDDTDREMAEKGLTEAEAAHNSSLRTFGWAGVGAGAALLVVLAVWLLIARRRAAALPQPGGWPHHAPQPQQPAQPPYGGYPGANPPR
ncbi:hypothetical protein ITI46_16460 [Streptomyces oryzae]|uniref:DUF3068 domain-containing protein n=1 Tax=Streptomyces oryzae TaxID=1434886 RepID=A0ABS3XCX1_9ACTN|nr:hypothetical protein [Streptomyces oryzae]MBO8193248.1 hypothetical protein [Streptomyces oryzae]